MIDLVWNFPLLVGQNEEWRGYLQRAVDALQVDDARELRPTFRGCDAGLRERAGKWLGVDAARAWIVCGGHHGALVSLLAAGLAGKAIAVEEITYMGILEQGKMLGMRVVGCAYDGEGMLPEALRAACESGEVRAVFLMPTVHNPLGCVAGLERRQALVEVAREFDLVIIEDDAYGFMERDAAANYAVLAPERTFYVRGLSKSYAPATRTGFVIAPEKYAAAMENAIKNSSTGTSLVHNVAAMELIEDGTLDRVMEAKRVEGAVRNAMGRKILGGGFDEQQAGVPQGLKPGSSASSYGAPLRGDGSEGYVAAGARCAWHLWVQLPGRMTAVEAQKACAERGVMVSGAAGFTAPSMDVVRALRLGMGGEVERGRVEEGLRVVASVLA